MTTGQAQFAKALTDPAASLPDGLVAWTGVTPVKRFAVYRNNVASGLAEALAKRFPATQRIVGEKFFRAKAKAYALQNPPRSPLLLHYGSGFAEFVETFTPAAELPYLADVVRLENARVEAYHAADAEPLAAQVLAELDGDQLSDLCFIPHPSLAVVRSPHPIVTIWAMNSGEQELGPLENWTGEDVLVVRPHLTVLTHRLPAGGAAFLLALLAGRTLGEAAEAGFAEATAFDLTANIAGLFAAGAVIEIVGG